MQRRQEIFRRLLLVAILALGTYLRLHGISFGLPDKFRPDEEYNVSRAVGFQTGNLNPAFFVYPTLYMYVLGVVYFLCGLVGQAVGLIDQGDVGAFFAQHLYGPAHLGSLRSLPAWKTTGWGVCGTSRLVYHSV
jgi:hypothetical protein